MKILCLVLSLISFNIYAITNHEIVANINPEEHTISVVDKIKLKEFDCEKALSFSLHSDLNPKILTPINAILNLKNTETINENHKLNISHYVIKLPCGIETITIQYSGTIYHPVIDPADPYSRGTADSPGLISKDGVVLSAGTYWYPQFENIDDHYVSFSLQGFAPKGWTIVSQGARVQNNKWVENSAQQDIYLIAANFIEYEKKLDDGTIVSAFLRTKDDSIAEKYLEVTSGYIERYSKLIGPYPYSKFALVENFWDTGFGMPSFTLLGSNIIRLPFIINTSYPHEILHDWWGNSVYVNYNLGNWSEGITAYMADHLMAELSMNGDTYRRDTLQKFTDFVTAKNDFPLNKFIERHDARSEAIGYGKSLMFFHMLRMKVGDDKFKQAFSLFYNQNKFKEAGFSDIKNAFESVTSLDLSSDFSQWVDRTGAPHLKVSEVSSTPFKNGFLFHAKIEQTQSEDIFNLNIPVAIHMEGKDQAIQKTFVMTGRTLEINLSFDSRPVWFQVDPEFDVFRRLSKDEVPAVLTMALGALKTYLVLPSSASENTLANWQSFIETIKPALPKDSTIKIITDSEVEQVPTDAVIWVLGKENKLVAKMSNLLNSQNVKITNEDITINGSQLSFANHSFTLLARDIKNNNQVYNFIATDADSSFKILANKLIHYGKYSYLGFEGDAVTNNLKGIWKLTNSSMSVPVVQTDGAKVDSQLGKLAKRSSLVLP